MLGLEGPRVIGAALDRGVPLEAIYVGAGSMRAFAPLVQRAVATGARVAELKEGVLEKLGTTRTPQPVLAVAVRPMRSIDDIDDDGSVLVLVDVSDPGNVGTIIRSAEAAGLAGVVLCGKSVDASNPKVVRSSAGAVFGVATVEASDAMETLEHLGRTGRRRVATRASGGQPLHEADLAGPCAIVLGNEAHGLGDDLTSVVDDWITIELAPPAESLNVAMAASIVAFEVARQRRAPRPSTAGEAS